MIRSGLRYLCFTVLAGYFLIVLVGLASKFGIGAIVTLAVLAAAVVGVVLL